MEYMDEDDSQDVVISNSSDWTLPSSKDIKSNDPFKAEGDALLKIQGLGTAMRRKIHRTLEKRFTGQEGTETQQILLAQAITGYATFDLIEPSYNLDYLSRIYEISPYNYAAINAKVANIVGLGYSFVETKKTNDALDSITDDKQLERARRKLNKLRQDLQDWLDSTNEEDTFTETLIKAYTDLEATGNGYLEIGLHNFWKYRIYWTYSSKDDACASPA